MTADDTGDTDASRDTDESWLDLTAGLAREADLETRLDAHDLYLVEASRTRLADRVGPARITLRCGRVLDGLLVPGPDAVRDHLTLRRGSRPDCLVRLASVVELAGTRPGLRPEPEPSLRTLGSWLRERWESGEQVSALTAHDRWISGRVAYVGADHVEVADGERACVLPFAGVEAWSSR